MREYLPVLMFVLVGIGFAAVTLGASMIVVPRTKNARKLAPYECGLEPVGTARQRIDIKFYLVAVMFILFDVEAVFMYPWAVAFRQLGLYGLIEMILFIVVLLVGYLYLLEKKALDWNSPA